MDFSELQRIVQNNDVELIQTLLCSKQIVSVRHSKSGDRVSHIICRLGKGDILEIILKANPEVAEVSNNDGKRPLHDAAQYCQVDCLKILLRYHVQIDPLKRADWTPLMLACTKSNTLAVRALLEAGADPCLKNKDGWNSFHLACREGHLSIVETLHKSSPDSWDTRSSNLRTPLHTAALHGNSEVVEWLVSQCSYLPNEKDSCGVTPLMDALRAGHVDTARILTKFHKADCHTEDKSGRQAVHMVAQSGQISSLEYLVRELKVSVNAASSETKERPLHMASKDGQVEMLQRLLDLDAEINATDNRGRTPLHIASGCQQASCVSLLLRNGASQLADNAGHTPRQLARKAQVVQSFDQIDPAG